MRHHNLKEPKVVDTQRRVRIVETASPIGFSSVERGGLRIASDQGLLIEGQGLVTGLFDVTGTLSGNGHYVWEGPSNISGPMTISGDMDISGDADFTGSVRAKYFVVEGPESYVQLNEGGFAFVNGAPGGTQSFAVTMSPTNGVSFNEGDIKMGALAESSNPDTHHVLVMSQTTKKLYLGPLAGGIGGNDPTNPGDPGATGLVKPFPWYTVTSEFGPRESPGGIGSTYHEGIDFGYYPASSGASIGSCGPGTVDFAGWAGGYGNAVQVDHGGGIKTYYAHMSGIAVSSGQSVNQMQTLGWIGSTGNSTGPHLHLETIINGTPQNPRNYLT